MSDLLHRILDNALFLHRPEAAVYASAYVEQKREECKEEIAEMRHFSPNVYHRLQICHPETKEYYIELITHVRQAAGRKRKTCYVSTEIGKVHLKENQRFETEDTPFRHISEQELPMIALKNGEWEEILLFLASNGMVLSTTESTENAAL